MLLWRASIPSDWISRVTGDLPSLLVDHAHLERRAATSALNLEKYASLYPHLETLNAIAIEELEHFQLVLELLKGRGIPYGPAQPSLWISGLMKSVRRGSREQVIDHLICCALIEGRSCEKFQILAEALKASDAELSQFYQGLVESEGNHYAGYLRMARDIDDAETDARLDVYLDLDAQLIQQPHDRAVLH